MERYFATTVKGQEPVLARELEELGAKTLESVTGGVGFEGSLETCYRANLWLRTALRVLRPIAEFQCVSPDDLYREVREVDWSRHLSPEGTLAVRASVRDNPTLTHSLYAAQKTKDAICDRFREETGKRPSVDTGSPDLALDLHIAGALATLSIDTTGESLHRRGYRLVQTGAPLRETLAAAIVGFTEWDERSVFCDLMCGSGTIAIEAAMKAARIAPGSLGRKFGFERSPGFDGKLWARLLAEARSSSKGKLEAPILAFDQDRRAVETAKENARRAGVAGLVDFRVQPLARFKAPRPGGPGVLVVNPPYGERQGEERALEALYREIGDVWKREAQGYTGWVFTGNLRLAKCVGLRSARRITLWNGPIESRLLKFELYAASRKSKYAGKQGEKTTAAPDDSAEGV